MRKRGTALIAVLFLALLLQGVVMSLLTVAGGQLSYTAGQFKFFESYENGMSGLHIAQVFINSAAYNAGPEGDHNAILYLADSTIDGQPGSSPMVSSQQEGTVNRRYRVFVNRIADRWYELIVYGWPSTVDESVIGSTYGQVQNSPEKPYATIKLRVRERDFFSRWNMFAENGWIVADDTNHWYGKVHSNNYIGFRNRYDTPRETLTGFDWRGNYYTNRTWDKGTRFYSQVTSTMDPRDYAETGGRDDAWFAVAPDWKAKEIEFPPVTALADVGAKARVGATVVKDDSVGTVYVGPKGVSIISKGSNKLDTYISFVNKPGLRRRAFITVKKSDGSVYWQTSASEGLEIPTTGFIIHSEDDIKGIGGQNNNEPAELNGKVTVVSQEGEVLLSDDIYYEDDNDNRAVIYDSSNPGGDNFFVNPNYNGNSSLGVMAAKSVYCVNNTGYARGDKDLIVCGVFAAGVGGTDSNGSFSWLPWGESRNGISGSSSLMRDLRVYGAMLSDGNSSTGLAHWKGYTSGGSPVSGYTSSVFRYDFNLLKSAPPEYMQINMPKYAGWQYIR